MNLYILRHGIAAKRGSLEFARDADRPLIPRGKREIRKIARAMDRLKLAYDLILASPYLRTRQTAKIVAEEMGLRKCLQLTDTLIPDGKAGKLIRLINEHGPIFEDVLLVGHEPYLSELISLLISGHTETGLLMKKGGLAKLSAESLRPGHCAVLEWLMTPKQLMGLA